MKDNLCLLKESTEHTCSIKETRNYIVKKAKLWLHTLMLSACLTISTCLPVSGAVDSEEQPPAEGTEAQEEPKDPNAPPDSYNWEVQSDSWPGWPKGPQVAAETAALMDLDTGEILYSKGIDEKRFPASTTKIMTALLAIENTNLTDKITFTNEVYNIEEGSTHIGVKPGETLTMEESLYAILLASANEVSSGVGEYISGTVSEFVNKMNERAAELGCENTHFMNAHGLHDDNHYTTARDLATIARAAYQNTTFRNIAKTEYYIIPKTNITDEERWLNNHHKMLLSGAQYYDGCTGGKTGYTVKAGNTLVTYAERSGQKLVSVVLADNAIYQYPDTASLLDYGFTSFHKVTLAEAGTFSQNYALPLDYYLFGMKDGGIIRHRESPFTVVLPGELTEADLTKTQTLVNGVQKTQYYLEDRLMSSGETKIEPSVPIARFLANASQSPSRMANASLFSGILSGETQDNSASLGGFADELKQNFRSLPRWKYPAMVLLAAALIFYIIVLTVRIKRLRKRRYRRRKKGRK